METIKIQVDVDSDYLLQVTLPSHIHIGRHEMVLIIDNDKVNKPSVDIMKYSGKIQSWPDDVLDYQQQLRSEWG